MKKKKDNYNFSDYERLTHEGRQLCEQREMNGGYCGSIDLPGHVKQLRDPKCWVHSSVGEWERVAKLARSGRNPFPTLKELRLEHEELRSAVVRLIDYVEIMGMVPTGAAWRDLRKLVDL